MFVAVAVLTEVRSARSRMHVWPACLVGMKTRRSVVGGSGTYHPTSTGTGNAH